MTKRRVIVLALAMVFLATVAVAQQDAVPLRNWPAPPYWLPTGAIPAGGTPGAEGPEVAAEQAAVRALPLVAIAPCRLLDTWTGDQPALLPGVAQEIVVVGQCGIPTQAQGVSLRLVGGEGSGGGVVTLGAAGEAGAHCGRLVLDRGQASFTTGVVGLDGSGRLVAVTEGGSQHLIVEVNGYYAAEPSVRSLNALAGDVMLRAGENVAITSEGSTVTIALAPAGSPGADRPGEQGQPVPEKPVQGAAQGTAQELRVNRVLRRQPDTIRVRAQALPPPPSSMYVGGALEMPSTTSVGAGTLTLGGNPFLHNYGPASDAGNTFVGQSAGNFTMGGLNPWEGKYNTASGAFSLDSNTTGYANTTSGYQSLNSNTTGDSNTASGYRSLALNTTGSGNTASGAFSLNANTTGSSNTASGGGSLYSNTTGIYNTASGASSLYSNTTAIYNTASGSSSLYSNTTGAGNTASGSSSLQTNTTGIYNTASGYQAMFYNTTGHQNTASGYQSLFLNTTGNGNIAIGRQAGFALTTGHDNIDIGNAGAAAEGNTIRIGNSSQTRTFIAGIRGVTTGRADAVAVLIDSNGQLGTVSSSCRFKKDMQDMGETSSRLMELRPVTFRYKAQPDGPLQYGLIAEEVEQVMPELVVRDATGQPETVAYHELPAMLLNELQKQHATIQAQQAQLGAQQTEIAGLRAARAERDVLAAQMKVQQVQVEALAARLAVLEGREEKHR
jgi:hypothetical protein